MAILAHVEYEMRNKGCNVSLRKNNKDPNSNLHQVLVVSQVWSLVLTFA
jgi:hypothetical protein